MAILFHADGLSVTDSWIRARPGTYAIADVRMVWVTRRQVGRGTRLLTATLVLAALLIGVAGLSGWVARNWQWIFAAPVLFYIAAQLGLLDPIAIYLEKRHHQLWIATDTTSVCLWKHNRVEVNKAARAIQRARERQREQNGV